MINPIKRRLSEIKNYYAFINQKLTKYIRAKQKSQLLDFGDFRIMEIWTSITVQENN